MKDATTIGVGILAFLGVIVLATFFGFLLAYPTMWLVNYLFNPTFLASIFNTGHFTVWQAWALNILVGFLSQRTSSSSSK